MTGATEKPRRRFELVLIKPSHYDDDGYVIQWFRSLIPSNTLSALHGLATDRDHPLDEVPLVRRSETDQ